MWRAAGLLEKRFSSAGFVVACPGREQAIQVETLRESIDGPSRGSIVAGKTRHILLQAQATLVASGTATIEAALMKCPMVIAYRMTPFTYMMGRMLVKLSDIGMVNIVAGRRICPEFIQNDATPQALADAVAPLLHDTPQRKTMVADLEEVCSVLGEGHAADRAAEQVLDALPLAASYDSTTTISVGRSG